MIEPREYWTLIDFCEAYELITTTSLKIKQRDYQTVGKYPIIDQGVNLIGGYYDNTDNLVSGDPPFVVFGDHTKVIKYVDFKFIPGADGIKILKPLPMFEPKLFYYFLKQLPLPDKGYARHFQHLSKSKIPLPPFPEQRAIVAKLETLLSELDNAVASLKLAKEQIKTYRQSVLKAAFTGKLTEEWRKQQTKLPTADELLEQIESERKKYYEQQLAEYESGKIKTKPKRPTNSDIVLSNDTDSMPKSWIRVRFDLLTDNLDYKRIPLSQEYRNSFKGVYPYYGACNIIDHVKDYLFEGDYLLIGEDGANLLSKSKALAFKVSGKFWVNNHAHILKVLDCSYIGFIEYQFNLTDIGKYVTGTAQPKLTQVNLAKIPMHFCSKAEQYLLIQEVESRISIANQLDQSISSSLSRTEALKQSLLKQAFEGKLLTEQELEQARKAPDWEPANKFLERIGQHKYKS